MSDLAFWSIVIVAGLTTGIAATFALERFARWVAPLEGDTDAPKSPEARYREAGE